jgi:hypothetical protein
VRSRRHPLVDLLGVAHTMSMNLQIPAQANFSGSVSSPVRQTIAHDNTIGGTQPAQRNVISGNGYSGVDPDGSGATNNKVEGNYIGTDASGTQDPGNSAEGVRIETASDTPRRLPRSTPCVK